MIQIQQIKLPFNHTEEELERKIKKLLRLSSRQQCTWQIMKKSVDARKKPDIYYIYRVNVSVDNEKKIIEHNKNKQIIQVKETPYCFPWKSQLLPPEIPRPVIIGFGPAGMFCGYMLARHGFAPVILERGKDVDARMADVARFWQEGVLNPESNVQFGEGGAGTFSDGKLNTLVNDKSGRNREVLSIFVQAGAPAEILYDYMPHIGTDMLCKVVKNIRNEIIAMGGSVYFGARVTDLRIEKNQVTGVVVNHQETISARHIVLAAGHSARDLFERLAELEVPMEGKDFAVGLRISHPQSYIDSMQYGRDNVGKLPPAPYKMAVSLPGGRKVYTFCMCPGGYIVNASSEPGRLAVNGMSDYRRDGERGNSAVVVNVTKQDFGAGDPLAGMRFQRQLEERAYHVGQGRVPVAFYGEYKNAVGADDRGKTTSESGSPDLEQNQDIRPDAAAIKGEWQFSLLHQILPAELNMALVAGIEQMGRQMPGFDRDDALLAGIESRTSSPVRILRGELMQSGICGLYPCGEGAGYAGGITSAAMDGIKVAEYVAGNIINNRRDGLYGDADYGTEDSAN